MDNEKETTLNQGNFEDSTWILCSQVKDKNISMQILTLNINSSKQRKHSNWLWNAKTGSMLAVASKLFSASIKVRLQGLLWEINSVLINESFDKKEDRSMSKRFKSKTSSELLRTQVFSI